VSEATTGYNHADASQTAEPKTIISGVAVHCIRDSVRWVVPLSAEIQPRHLAR
jgi:hypothetical protein